MSSCVVKTNTLRSTVWEPETLQNLQGDNHPTFRAAYSAKIMAAQVRFFSGSGCFALPFQASTTAWLSGVAEFVLITDLWTRQLFFLVPALRLSVASTVHATTPGVACSIKLNSTPSIEPVEACSAEHWCFPNLTCVSVACTVVGWDGD